MTEFHKIVQQPVVTDHVTRQKVALSTSSVVVAEADHKRLQVTVQNRGPDAAYFRYNQPDEAGEACTTDDMVLESGEEIEETNFVGEIAMLSSGVSDIRMFVLL